MKQNNNRIEKQTTPKQDNKNALEDLIMDDIIPNPEIGYDFSENYLSLENDPQYTNPNAVNTPILVQSKGRIQKKESKTSFIFNLYFNTLQVNGIVDSNEFLRSNGENYRRKLGQIISVLTFFGIVKKEKNIVTLCSNSRLNPPIKIRNLEKEIKQLEDEIEYLKGQLAAIKFEHNGENLDNKK